MVRMDGESATHVAMDASGVTVIGMVANSNNSLLCPFPQDRAAFTKTALKVVLKLGARLLSPI
jgi:hypothetical protein